MNYTEKWIAFSTVVRKEIQRIMRIWSQTLLPPAVTTILYFIIFGKVIGSQIGLMDGYPYIQYIAPGLIMLNIITSSFSNSVSSFYSAKFQRSIEELLVSPMSNLLILLGYMSGGVFRGLIVGFIVSLIALFFTHLHIYSLLAIIAVTILSSSIFSLAGIINGIIANSFDDISIIPTFVLTPLTYLGGVFYSITLLPSIWQTLSLVNPIVYIVNTFRYGFLGVSDSHLLFSYMIMIFFIVVLFALASYLISRSSNLRS